MLSVFVFNICFVLIFSKVNTHVFTYVPSYFLCTLSCLIMYIMSVLSFFYFQSNVYHNPTIFHYLLILGIFTDSFYLQKQFCMNKLVHIQTRYMYIKSEIHEIKYLQICPTCIKCKKFVCANIC